MALRDKKKKTTPVPPTRRQTSSGAVTPFPDKPYARVIGTARTGASPLDRERARLAEPIARAVHDKVRRLDAARLAADESSGGAFVGR